MFLAIVFILIGLILFLNALGLIAGDFWSFIWAIIFLAIGIKLLVKRGVCPLCKWKYFEKRIYEYMNEKTRNEE